MSCVGDESGEAGRGGGEGGHCGVSERVGKGTGEGVGVSQGEVDEIHWHSLPGGRDSLNEGWRGYMLGVCGERL